MLCLQRPLIWKQLAAVDYSNNLGNPTYTVSGDSLTILGIPLTMGYTVQPSALTSTTSGQTVTLTGTAAISIVNVLPLNSSHEWQVQVNGKWYSLADAKTAGFISSYDDSDNTDGYHLLGTLTESSTLHVTVASNFTGTMLFQMKASLTTIGITLNGSNKIGSNIAEVDVYSSAIDADNLTVDGEDYVMNSQSGSYSAVTDPGNATGTVTWTSSDTSLATVSDSGVVTAASSGSGVVTITATITNSDGTTLTASKQVTVGNGLSDKTVDAGSTLTWTPDGTIEDPGDGSISYQ